MRALKHKKTASKREREHNEVFLQSMEFFLYAAALELHESHGFGGKKRLPEFAENMIKRLLDYIDRYDEDCTLAAMKKKCKEIGFQVEFT